MTSFGMLAVSAIVTAIQTIKYENMAIQKIEPMNVRANQRLLL
jgi:hypothetical protein